MYPLWNCRKKAIICNESDGTDAAGLKFERIIDGMKTYTAEDITAALKEAGFSNAESDHHKVKSRVSEVNAYVWPILG